MVISKGNSKNLAMLVFSILLISLLLTSTVVSGGGGEGQICNANNLSNCSINNIIDKNMGCYNGVCTLLCGQGRPLCKEGHKCGEHVDGNPTTYAGSYCVKILTVTPVVIASEGESTIGKLFAWKMPAEIFQSFLMKFLIMFLLLLAIVYVALQTAKFPRGTGVEDELVNKSRFFIAVIFALMAAIVIAANPGLFPAEIIMTKFMIFIFMIVLYFIIIGLVFKDDPILNESLFKSIERKIIAVIFLITIFTMLFLDTPIQLALENIPVCQDPTWNEKLCNDASPGSCLAADYASGQVVCCENAYSSSSGKIGKYNLCKSIEKSQKNILLPMYSPGTTKDDLSVCKFDMNLSMPLLGHNMCAVLGEFLIGPKTYQDYKGFLQLAWLLAAALILIELWMKFKDKSIWFFGAIFGIGLIGFLHFVLGIDFVWSSVIIFVIFILIHLWWKYKSKILLNKWRAKRMGDLRKIGQKILKKAREAKAITTNIKSKTNGQETMKNIEKLKNLCEDLGENLSTFNTKLEQIKKAAELDFTETQKKTDIVNEALNNMEEDLKRINKKTKEEEERLEKIKHIKSEEKDTALSGVIEVKILKQIQTYINNAIGVKNINDRVKSLDKILKGNQNNKSSSNIVEVINNIDGNMDKIIFAFTKVLGDSDAENSINAAISYILGGIKLEGVIHKANNLLKEDKKETQKKNIRADKNTTVTK